MVLKKKKCKFLFHTLLSMKSVSSEIFSAFVPTLDGGRCRWFRPGLLCFLSFQPKLSGPGRRSVNRCTLPHPGLRLMVPRCSFIVPLRLSLPTVFSAVPPQPTGPGTSFTTNGFVLNPGRRQNVQTWVEVFQGLNL